ncbi:MAG: hypothetical protein RIR69_1284 [Actinomycetota bacterium]
MTSLVVATGNVSATEQESDPADATTTTTTIPPVIKKSDVKVVYNVKTRDKVVFITIDDGFYATPELARIIRRYKVPITTFAMPRLVERDKKWFLSKKNMTFENHTITHRSMTPLSVAGQKREICGANRQLKKTTGVSPVFFRPPGGNWNEKTRAAVAACGMKHIVMWNAIAEKGQLRIPGGKLERGDIILMHYIPSVAPTLELLLKKIKNDGLKPALLRDYLR